MKTTKKKSLQELVEEIVDQRMKELMPDVLTGLNAAESESKVPGRKSKKRTRPKST